MYSWKGALSGWFVPLVAAKSSASHLCKDGALMPARIPSWLASLELLFKRQWRFSPTASSISISRRSRARP